VAMDADHPPWARVERLALESWGVSGIRQQLVEGPCDDVAHARTLDDVDVGWTGKTGARGWRGSTGHGYLARTPEYLT
jgi:hypothetical protein